MFITDNKTPFTPFAVLPNPTMEIPVIEDFLHDIQEMQIGFGNIVIRANKQGMWFGKNTYAEAQANTVAIGTDGSISARTLTLSTGLDIPDATTANSTHIDSTGNQWWGCNVANFNANHDNAPAYILNTGVAKFQSLTVVGATITTTTISSTTLSACTISTPTITNGSIVGTSYKTANSGQRIEMSTAGNLTAYNSSNVVVFEVNGGIPKFGVNVEMNDFDLIELNKLISNDSSSTYIWMTNDIEFYVSGVKKFYLNTSSGNLEMATIIDMNGNNIEDGGNIKVRTAKGFYVDGVQIISNQQAAVADVTGTAGALYTATEQAMINNLQAQLNSLLAKLRTHGLIAT